jgi:hypothetical protein
MTHSNRIRVHRCEQALLNYQTDDDLDTTLADFLADAMHWCQRRQSTFADALRIAELHFTAETQ